MEILRVPPYPISTTWTLPLPNYTYTIYVEDLVDSSSETSEITSDAEGKVIYELPLSKVEFDRKFLIRFYDTDQVNILYEDSLDIVRPYANPKTLAETATDIAEYTTYEMIARSIIDTYTGYGFYNQKTVQEVEGNGSDYMPVWRDVNRILKVYENNVLVYDINTPDENLYDYKITDDNSAIVKTFTDLTNNIVTANPIVPISRGDLVFDARRYGQFPKGFDYIFILDEGFRAVPSEVQKATRILIEDIKCGKLDYYTRYINSYNTDQFKINFDKSMMSGTGNMIVDKILDKYIKSIASIGVL